LKVFIVSEKQEGWKGKGIRQENMKGSVGKDVNIQKISRKKKSRARKE